MRESALAIDAVVCEQLHDEPLLLSGGNAATPTAAGGPNGEIERRRAVSILPQRIGAVREKDPHCRRAAGAHRTMQRRHAALVGRVRIGAGAQQVRNDCRLRSRRPRRGSWLPITGIVQRLCAAPIPCVDVGATADELARDVSSVRHRRDVKGRVARVHIMLDLFDEV